jgi:8-oxo-dGTP pyrophosphatase MutT (NUDIX family)
MSAPGLALTAEVSSRWNSRMSENFANILKTLLASREPSLRAEWDARPAAVLIPMYIDQSQWHLVYTRRTDRVEDHRGQVSFPGGRIEDQDASPQATALREAEEEIGVRQDSVHILGSLDVLLTVTQFQIHPFVGMIPWPYHFNPNPDEVARVFSVPLHWLLEPDNLETHFRQPFPDTPEVPVYYFKPYQDEIIWGATARITLSLLELMRTILPD